MIEIGMDWQVIDTPIQLKEVSAPATPFADKVKLYAKDKAGVSNLYWKSDAGTEYDLSLSATHALLSASHSDTLAGTVVRGDLVVGNSTPKWSRLARGTSGQFLKTNASGDLEWATLATGITIGDTVTSGTAGSVLYLGASNVLAQDNANFFWDRTNKRLGVGTASPSFGVHAVGASPQCHVAGNRLSADALGPAFIGQKARGTPGSPSVVLADDQLLQLVGQGYENGSYHTQANIKQWAAENWGASAKGTYITFETSATGGTTIAERLRIEASGDISHASGVRHRMLSQNRFRYLNSMASVKKSGDQTLTTATVTAVAFGAEDVDTDSMHDNSSDNSRITIKITGKYLIGGVLNYAANGTGVRQVRLHKNGSATPDRIATVPGMAGDNARPAAVWLVSATATDYYEIHAYQDSGGDLALSSSAPNCHFFAIYVGE